MVSTKVPVTWRAVLQRIKRRLAKEDETLRTALGSTARAAFGHYFVVNKRSNQVTMTHVSPPDLARKLGVLAAWETVQEEEDDGRYRHTGSPHRS